MHPSQWFRSVAPLLLAATLLASCSQLLGIESLSEGAAPSITSFAFDSSNNSALPADVTATITGMTVMATVPFGTPVTALKATFQSSGAMVTVSGTAQASGVTTNDFTNPVTYHLIGADGLSTDYTVTVAVAASNMKELTAFAFLSAINPALSSDVTATIVGTTVNATLPFGSDVTALKATFQTTGTTVSVAGVTQSSGVTAHDFTSPVVYRVTADDGSMKDYTVTVAVATSTMKDLTSFAFLSANNSALGADVTAVISGTTISSTVPFGTAVTALKATFQTTGMSVKVAGVTQVSGVTANNFTTPVVYRVTAADASTKDYTVTVTVAASPAKDLTSFAFLSVNNSGLGADVAATITGTGITATVPFGTAVTALKATFQTTGAMVTVSGVTQTSGVTANNFTSPVMYRVAAADGSTKDYTVTITVAANPARDITSFAFLSVDNSGLSTDVTGVITGQNIAVTVPVGTVVTGLKATFQTTGMSVTVGAVAQTSGVTTNNFTNPVVYRVTAANGMTKDYTVTVTAAATGVTFATGADFGAGMVTRAVASADLNGDGRLDMIAVNEMSNTVSAYINTTPPGASTATFTVKADFAVGTRPQSIAAGDLNGDGRPDIAVSSFNADTVSVLFNATAPGSTVASFSAKVDFATGSVAEFVAIADFNRDAKPDLAVANANGDTVSLLRNTTAPGAGTPSFAPKVDFATGTPPAGADGIAVDDFNGDGKPDLAIANNGSSNVSVLLNTTNAGSTAITFATKVDFATGVAAASVVAGDFNGDGKSDLAVLNTNPRTVSILLGTTAPGAATPTFASKFDFSLGVGPQALAIGDIDGDGRPDLAVANGSDNTVSVLLDLTQAGATAPSFAPKLDFATGALPGTLVLSDFNGDGKPDFATPNSTGNSVTVRINTTLWGRSLAFTAGADFTTGTSPDAIAMGDFNGDGKPDLVTSSNNASSMSLLLNTKVAGTGAPSFATKVDFTTSSTPAAVVVADFNVDGVPDIATANLGADSVSVFINTTAPGAATPSLAAKVDFTTGVNPQSLAVGDLNGDFKPDLAIANRSSNTVSVLLNTTVPGATVPSFAAKADFATGTVPYAIAIGDVNGDFVPDLAVANFSGNTVSVLRNITGAGATTASFAGKVDFATGVMPDAIALRDLNGDGKADLVAANNSANTVSILLGTTTMGSTTLTFAAKADIATGSAPEGIGIGDLNGDGRLDVAIANQGSDNASVLLNIMAPGATSASFGTKVDFAAGIGSVALLAGDLSSDGRCDLAVVNFNSNSVSVLLAQ